LRDEEKNSKIYQAICKALLSEKDLNKIIDKTRVDDDGELIIPHIKPKQVDIIRPQSSAKNSKPKSNQLPDTFYNNNTNDGSSKQLALTHPSLQGGYQDTSLPPMAGSKQSKASPNMQGIASGISPGNSSPHANKKDKKDKKSKPSKQDNDNVS
jgi:hypothetical protein